MGFADVWNKTLVYFGIAEEEDWDEDGYLTDEELQRVYSDRPNVRRLAPRRRGRDEFDDWTDPESSAPTAARTSVLRPAPAPRSERAAQAARRRERPERGAAEAARPPASISSCRAASTTRSRSPTASRKACR